MHFVPFSTIAHLNICYMLIRISSLLILLIACWSCESTSSDSPEAPSKARYKVSIFYPAAAGKRFDMSYYQSTHMPMVAGFLGKNLEAYEINRGISGRTPADTAQYLAMGHFYIHSVEEYNKAIAQNREAVMADIPKYTDIQPVILISEIIP